MENKVDTNPYSDLKEMSNDDLRVALQGASQAEIGTRGLKEFWGTSHNDRALDLVTQIEAEIARRADVQ